MNDLVATLPKTGAIAEMTDANTLVNIMRTADSLVKLCFDPEKERQVIKVRNHALRRLGQMYNSIENNGGAGRGKTFSDTKNVLTRTQFQKELKLGTSAVLKIKSLAALDDFDFEAREYNTDEGLYHGTEYWEKVLKDRARVKDAFAAKKREDEERERQSAHRDEQRDRRHQGLDPHPDVSPEIRQRFQDTSDRIDAAVLERAAQDRELPNKGRQLLLMVRALNNINPSVIDTMDEQDRKDLWVELDLAYDNIATLQARCQS